MTTLARGPRKAVLPDVRGLDLRVALRALELAGFSKVQDHLVDARGTEDQVVQQEPVPGGFLPLDTPVRLFVDRPSWIRHLPSLYQLPSFDGTHLVQGLLWITQSVFARIERTLDRVAENFDPMVTPEPLLPWLASWLALGLDAGWDERTRRRVVKDAAHLYRIRGSKEALVTWIELVTGLVVQIEENAWPFDGFRVGVHARVGDRSMIVERPVLAHAFVVHVPVAADDLSDEDLARLYRVIEAEKPAHTVYCLTFAERADARLDRGVLRVGVDRVGERPSEITPDTQTPLPMESADGTL